MTLEGMKSMCEMLRAQGVKRAMFDRETAELTLVEFFDAAASIPTAEEQAAAAPKGNGDEPESGFLKAIECLRTGGVPPGET